MTTFVLLGIFVALFCNDVRSAEVCCDYVGCFTDDAPFDDIALPMCIEEMTPHYYMYTQSNTATAEEFDHTTVPSVFVGSRRTIFLVHGWNSNGNGGWVHDMKDTLLAAEDANVVIVDWGGGAELANYFQSASNTRSMGAYSALVFDNLVSNGASSTWCIGHSLGAHLCGHTGMRVTTPLERTTGLDPAGPWFQGKLDRTVGINPTSGNLVDIIHTDVSLGQLRDLGHVDFYPNGGAEQPGCFKDSSDPDAKNSCAHARAYEYLRQSVQTNCFLAWSRCTDYNDIPGSCTSCTCGTAACASMGYSLTSGCSTSGWYYIQVTDSEPYCVS
jgi:pimeloyl-ACP methyl ester carboxylesterase